MRKILDINGAIVTLRRFYIKWGRLPTYDEMCSLFHYSSKGSSQYLVKKLLEHKVLEKDEKGNLLPRRLFQIPQLGIIKAGSPTQAEIISDKNIDLYQYLLNTTGTIYSLLVSGDSMKDEGIMDGDIVIVDKSMQPRNGDIVAACVDNEWTVKYFNNQGGVVILVPANEKYQPIYPKQSLQIGGVVISTMRKYH